MDSRNKKIFKEYEVQFKKMSDQELIERFNHDMGHNGWIKRRGKFLSALQSEFDRRGFDISKIGGFNMKNKIKLNNKIITKLNTSSN